MHRKKNNKQLFRIDEIQYQALRPDWLICSVLKGKTSVPKQCRKEIKETNIGRKTETFIRKPNWI